MPTLTPLLLWRQLRSVDASASASPEIVGLLRAVPVFAPMTGIGLERLARSAHSVSRHDTEPVVRQGEVGDLFYVVVEGEVVICQEGRERRRLGPGDAFGEIAMLKAVPRIASVISVGASKLLSIGNRNQPLARDGRSPTSRRTGTSEGVKPMTWP